MDPAAGFFQYNTYSYCANNPILFMDAGGQSLLLACVLIGSCIGIIVGAVIGNNVAEKNGYCVSDGWDYLKYVMGFAALGGALGGVAGWAFAGTSLAANISWTVYKTTHVIGTTSYAIGHAFEEWFYKAYNVINKQVRYGGYRFDAIVNNSIVELKNYDWSKYDNFSSLAKRFVNQATNYLAFVGQNIENQIIKGVTFCFSTKPPQEIIEELQKIGVTVNWIQ